MNLRLRLVFLLLGVLALGLLLVAVAGAAFNVPFYASPPSVAVSYPNAGIDSQGNVVFNWVTAAAPSNDEVVQVRARSSAGTFTQPQTLSTTGHDAEPLPHVAVAGNGTAVAGWQIYHGDAITA